MWPLRRSPTAAGRSRLTLEPAPSAPRLVRARVSGDRSHQNASGSILAAVRQTPFTAMLDPSFVSARTVLHLTCILAPAIPIVPASSTIPVNMSTLQVSFHREFVGRNGMQRDAIELDGIPAMQPAGSS